jgi:ribulose-phosphate 3-epimerase
VGDIADAGADNITIHVEATPHVHYTLQAIRERGCSAGVAICPSTPIEALSEVAREALDLALCMSVNPGWGGQRFIAGSMDKLDRLRRLVPQNVAVEVDGGIHTDTARPVVDAGANLLVAGSAVFASDDPAQTYRSIVEAAGAI